MTKQVLTSLIRWHNCLTLFTGNLRNISNCHDKWWQLTECRFWHHNTFHVWEKNSDPGHANVQRCTNFEDSIYQKCPRFLWAFDEPTKAGKKLKNSYCLCQTIWQWHKFLYSCRICDHFLSLIVLHTRNVMKAQHQVQIQIRIPCKGLGLWQKLH